MTFAMISDIVHDDYSIEIAKKRVFGIGRQDGVDIANECAAHRQVKNKGSRGWCKLKRSDITTDAGRYRDTVGV